MSAPTEIPAENDADIDTPEAASGDTQVTQTALIPAEYLYPFVLVTTLFALWGFANNYTDPLVRAFKEIFLISNFESSLVQLAFYGGYGTMAIPAALVIRKYSFKTGIIVGLALYAIGALLTIPASLMMAFWLFLISFYILTFGLAFLETAANPYILSMGPEQSATRRLNFAQAFNPVGTLTGMFVASTLILPYLDVAEFRNEYTTVEVAAEDGTTSRVLKPEFEGQLPSVVDGAVGSAMEELRENDPERFSAMQSHDLGVVRLPYVAIAAVVLGVMLMFVFSKMPDTGRSEAPISTGQLIKNLTTARYIGGVLAQGVYVGAQIMTWTFTIHYGMTLLGMSAAEAQNWNILANVIFLVSRFAWTFTLKYVNAGTLLACLAAAGAALSCGAVFVQGMAGMYCLVAVSACLGVMFPTIYGLALDGLTVDDAKLGSAGLIVAIVGGALLPPLQGSIIDGGTVVVFGQTLEGVRASYLLPAGCLALVIFYGVFMAFQKPQAPATGEAA